MGRTRIKVCGLTTREAVDCAVDAGVDACGFVFTESVRRIRPVDAIDLVGRVPAFVASVGVFRHPTPEELWAVRDAVKLTLWQMDHDATDSTLALEGGSPPVVQVYRLNEADDLEWLAKARHPAPAILIEGPLSGSGRTIDWPSVAPVAKMNRVILAGGLTPENVGEAIRLVRPFGVDVSSGVELAPGVKDAAKIRAFVEAVRAADGLA
jgi:phosphoribosylanthranilate isomerase